MQLISNKAKLYVIHYLIYRIFNRSFNSLCIYNTNSEILQPKKKTSRKSIEIFVGQMSEKMGAIGEGSLAKEYGYVVLVLVFYCFFNFWMAFQVGKARKKYKVFYPTLYALESDNKDANLFNCVQRGHQNSLEMMPMFFILMILGGMRHPCICAGLGLLYIVSRYFYFTGYSSGDPQKRLSVGKYGFFALMGLMICSISFGVKLLTS